MVIRRLKLKKVRIYCQNNTANLCDKTEGKSDICHEGNYLLH